MVDAKQDMELEATLLKARADIEKSAGYDNNAREYWGDFLERQAADAEASKDKGNQR